MQKVVTITSTKIFGITSPGEGEKLKLPALTFFPTRMIFFVKFHSNTYNLLNSLTPNLNWTLFYLVF